MRHAPPPLISHSHDIMNPLSPQRVTSLMDDPWRHFVTGCDDKAS